MMIRSKIQITQIQMLLGEWSECYTSLIIMYAFIISSHIFEFKYLKNLFFCLVNDTSLSSLFRLVCPWSWRKKTQIGWISLLEHLTMFCCNYDIFCMWPYGNCWQKSDFHVFCTSKWPYLLYLTIPLWLI